MEHDVVLADEVNHACVLVLPPLLPCAPLLGLSITQFLGVGDVADWRIKPHIQHLALCSLDWYWNTPAEVACHGTRMESAVEPALALTIDIWSPFLVSFENPLLEPRLILVEWQVPVLGLALHEWVACDGIVWVDEFVR